LNHPASAATMLRSANYAGIVAFVSRGTDPDFFYANQALDNIIHVWHRLEPYHCENEVDWEVSGKSNTWYVYFQSLRIVG